MLIALIVVIDDDDNGDSDLDNHACITGTDEYRGRNKPGIESQIKKKVS